MKEQLATDDIQTFIVDGDKYKTRLSKKYIQRKPYQPNDPKKVTAFIPGTIRKVLVNEGDTINKGDNLLVLEAMKMNNSILASAQGVIARVLVKTGQVVSKNQLLIELE
ncbi:MAG: acetyl-CoA carboxylase biotin carboxyl carrier protein subunit [Bacteroidales bacterium]